MFLENKVVVISLELSALHGEERCKGSSCELGAAISEVKFVCSV